MELKKCIMDKNCHYFEDVETDAERNGNSRKWTCPVPP